MGGDGSLSGSGQLFTLDLGEIVEGSGEVRVANLAVVNDVADPADNLDGVFDTTAIGDFLISGFDAFFGLAPGDSFGGLTVTFVAGALAAGTDLFGEIILDPTSVFPTLENLPLAAVTLAIVGSVVSAPAAVPEPSTMVLFVVGLIGLVVIGRSRRRRI